MELLERIYKLSRLANLSPASRVSVSNESAGFESLEAVDGIGSCIAHHGEILQGVFQSDRGQCRRGLVTLPWANRIAVARFCPAPGAIVQAKPYSRSTEKAAWAARLALNYLGRHKTGGILELSSDIPVGRGLGSSTSDVVATIRAVANAYRTQLSGPDIARLAVKAEEASDPTMFEGPAVLFAHREGDVIRTFSQPLPQLEVLGFDTAQGQPGVRTLDVALPRYTDADREQFMDLRDRLRAGIEGNDLHAVGAVASASATINQRFLPKPNFAQLQEIARVTGAVGVQVAHSGTVAGLLFDARACYQERNLALAVSLLILLGFTSSYRFTT